MADFADLLAPAAVAAGVVVTTRKPLIVAVAGVLAAAHGLDRDEVAARLTAREKLGSTGFGGGIALPHARIDGIDQPVGAFVRLERPVPFGAIDRMPVDMVFALLSPTTAGAQHLKALARISRAMRDQGFVEKLRGAGSGDALYALLAAGHGG